MSAFVFLSLIKLLVLHTARRVCMEVLRIVSRVCSKIPEWYTGYRTCRWELHDRWLFGQGILQMMQVFLSHFNQPYPMHSICLWGENLSLNISIISTPWHSQWGQQIYYSAVTSPICYWHCEPRCLHSSWAFPPESKQTTGLSMHTSIVCS